MYFGNSKYNLNYKDSLQLLKIVILVLFSSMFFSIVMGHRKYNIIVFIGIEGLLCKLFLFFFHFLILKNMVPLLLLLLFWHYYF